MDDPATSIVFLSLLLGTVFVSTRCDSDNWVRLAEFPDYYMAFRITANIPDAAYDQYRNTGDNDDIKPDVPIGCKTTDGSLPPCDRHYRSGLLDLWGSLTVDKVRVSVYKDTVEQQYFEFNGFGSDNQNWFHPDRLLSTSYSDLPCVMFNPPIGGRYFSLAGNNYGGCNNDAGWLVVVTTFRHCEWEKNSSISYSTTNTRTVWNDPNTVGYADALIVSVKLKEPYERVMYKVSVETLDHNVYSKSSAHILLEIANRKGTTGSLDLSPPFLNGQQRVFSLETTYVRNISEMRVSIDRFDGWSSGTVNISIPSHNVSYSFLLDTWIGPNTTYIFYLDFDPCDVTSCSAVAQCVRHCNSEPEFTCTHDSSFTAPPCGTPGDTEAPVFDNHCACDKNEYAAPLGQLTYVNWTEPAVWDNSGDVIVPVGNATPGSAFRSGLTVVTYEATDASGNKATCHFSVTVTVLECTIPDLGTTIAPDERPLNFACPDGFILGAWCTLYCEEGYRLLGNNNVSCERPDNTNPERVDWNWHNPASEISRCIVNISSTLNRACCNCHVTRNLIEKYNLPLEELKVQLADELKKELTINTSDLSTTRAKKISAPDQRQSSQSLGYLGIAFLAAVLGFILISDLNRLFFCSCCVGKGERE